MEYCALAEQLARKAGDIIKTNFTLGMRREWKSDGTPITATDQAINDLVISEVARYFPDHAVLGEEGSGGAIQSDYCWVCDPVDGTTPFSHGIPVCGFMLALCFQGYPILGVVYEPFLDRLFVAEKGKGAFLNGKQIKASDSSSLNSKVIAVDGPGRGFVFAVSEDLQSAGAIPFTVRCIAYGGMLTAAGDVIGAIFSGVTPWDGAAIQILVEEAGGKVTSLNGQAQRYDQDVYGFVASGDKVHAELLQIVANHIAQAPKPSLASNA